MSTHKPKIASPAAFGLISGEDYSIYAQRRCIASGSYLVAYYDRDRNPRARIVARKNGLLRDVSTPDVTALTTDGTCRAFVLGSTAWRISQDGRAWYATREIVMLLNCLELAQRYQDVDEQIIYVSASGSIYDEMGNSVGQEESYFFRPLCRAYPIKIARLFDESSPLAACSASLEEVMNMEGVDGLAIAVNERFVHYVDFHQAKSSQSTQDGYDRPLASLDV